ncbi:polysaccharide export outer membrane protein [Mucilaginibacter yixingensis]|uniref:Polysaccharide export outer membrane protein n=1 Tax=Mucilaginibacter yixingensis TaxID=1295612 RepID=A0A2T5JCH2_9SPHI|nr:polysaccharide biosynthesis/export family protein [Mucilaginibacter yixingensis]PTQ99365.1 polysaccharide export outer membrane protein [Mucilaginibacter yixingensis]
MKITLNRLHILSIFAVLCLLFSSCSNEKNLVYFTNLRKDSVILVQAHALQTIIAKNDILQVNISTLDETTNRDLNLGASANSNVAGAINGYLVDETGVIKLPQLGAIKAEGLTKNQLAQVITDALLSKQLAKDPIVTVRILNYKITVLGEVQHPGVVAVPNERITLPEALGEAGDLTPYASRDSIRLIREANGKRIVKIFSLNKDQAFDSDIYNLQNQDIIYVKPSKLRAESTDRSLQYASIGMSAVSLLLVLYIQLVK